jgi:hypothetical protein
MALTTVSELRTTLGVGTLYTDAVLQEVCDAADAVLLPMLWNNYTFNVGHSNTTTEGTLYFEQSIKDVFYVGQTVTVSGNGAPHNGSKAITAMTNTSITYAVTGTPTAQPQHTVTPFGQVSIVATVDYTTDTAIQNAALMISVDIWQARTATLGGSNLVDFQPSPYRMSAQLLAKIRGLIAHALDPRSLIG